MQKGRNMKVEFRERKSKQKHRNGKTKAEEKPEERKRNKPGMTLKRNKTRELKQERGQTRRARDKKSGRQKEK